MAIPDTSSIANGTGDRKLESWKEIAAYFARDLRTVIRWEKELGLPVHRYPGKTKGRVYALESELRAWAETPRVTETPASPPADNRPHEQKGDPNQPEVQAQAETRKRLSWSGTHIAMLLAVLTLAALAGAGWWLGWVRAREQEETNRNSATAHIPPQEAREFYLKGRYYWSKRNPESLNRAMDYFSQAILRDPNYAQAYVGLADSYNLMREFASMPEAEAYAKAYVAASRAEALDPNSAEAHASLGFIDFWSKRDVDASSREFKRAIELNPAYVDAYHWYGNILGCIGRVEEGLAYLNRAQELDPASSSIQADRALLLAATNRAEDGIALLRQMETTDPNFISPHSYLAGIYLQRMNCADFLAESEKQARLSGNTANQASLREAKKGFASGGCAGMLRNMLTQQRHLYLEHKISAYRIAMTESLLGDQQAALQDLRLSMAQNETELAGIRASFEFAPLRANPEFRQMVVAAGLPPLE